GGAPGTALSAVDVRSAAPALKGPVSGVRAEPNTSAMPGNAPDETPGITGVGRISFALSP
ncbi:hypothetical protein, partial [Brevibacterium celere]|uniref:hypothetical protein n=1 Tax=Brevibacterium celere TaxID=225845 RepID=UPI0031D2191B